MNKGGKADKDDAYFAEQSKIAGGDNKGTEKEGPESGDTGVYPVRQPGELIGLPSTPSEGQSEHAKAMKGLQIGGTESGLIRRAEGGSIPEPTEVVDDTPVSISDTPQLPAALLNSSPPALQDSGVHEMTPEAIQASTPEQSPGDQAYGTIPEQPPEQAPAQPQAPQPTQSRAPAAQDTYGTQATQDTFNKGLEQQRQGIAGEVKAAQIQANAEMQALKAQQVKQQELQNDYKSHFDRLDQERQAFQQDVQNNHIDPQHYMNSMGTSQRISTAIGLILGGIGGGLTGQQNSALQFLNQQIDNDISAQKAELGKKENLLSANMRQFGNLRDATDMTRIMQTDAVSNQLKQAAAQATDPMAKARALKELGALETANADRVGQMAMRSTLLGGLGTGKVSPEHIVNLVVPQHDRAEATKELKEAQNLMAVRDNTLNAFDQLLKINTLGNRITSPLQSSRQIDSLRGAALDKLTKDISGRVTPETVHLIGGLFNTLGNNDESNAIARNQINALLTHSAHFPTLKNYGIDVGKLGRYDMNGTSRIQESAPH